MPFTQLTTNLNIHQSLPDKPTLNADELKIEFDRAGNLIKEYLNTVFLPELETTVTNLQNKDTSLETTMSNVQKIVNEAVNDITTINSSMTKITVGKELPETLEEGEVFLQYFD